MPSIDPSYVNQIGRGDGSIILATWVLITATPFGTPIEWPEWADITFIVGDAPATDVFGGATVAVTGGNILPADYPTHSFPTLNNAAGGTAATATTQKAFTVIENPRFIAPILSVVGVAASITVTALLRRANNMRQ